LVYFAKIKQARWSAPEKYRFRSERSLFCFFFNKKKTKSKQKQNQKEPLFFSARLFVVFLYKKNNARAPFFCSLRTAVFFFINKKKHNTREQKQIGAQQETPNRSSAPKGRAPARQLLKYYLFFFKNIIF